MLGLHSVQTGHIRTLTSDVGWRSAPLHNLKVETTNKKSHLVEAVSLDRTHLEKDDLKGKTVTVLGLGVSGRAATRLALARGATVVAVDSNESMIPLEHDPLFGGWHFTNLRTELGQCNIQYLSNSDRIVVSPGVSLEKYNLTALMQSGVQVMSELDFAAESIPTTVKVVAVTGTNGKSTVATFTGQILRHAGIEAFVGGNLGKPLSDAAFQCLSSSKTEPELTAAVVEVSSYQMEIPNRHFKPSVAVVLNLTPDHLERHKTMQNYAMMKCRLFSHMDPSHLAVIPSGDQLLEEAAYCCGSQGTRAWIGDLPGVKLDGEAAQATILVPTLGIMSQIYLGNLKTIGMHNAYNAGTAALLALGLDLGVDFEAVNHAMEVLEPPPHRMQVVTKDDQGVLWVDDSKATNVEATYAGLEGLRGQPSVVLLGGIAKVLNKEGHIGFERLVDCLKYHKAVITFGASGKKIKQTLDGAGISIPCVEVTSMRDAVSTAKFFAKHGDAILLSPGCARALKQWAYNNG
ncbi:hypothetical protein SUGI_0414770 [Cryptomeria japonica]|nr:hypothetical protein SUGI_0414770 [Cryptomeria japonica]